MEYVLLMVVLFGGEMNTHYAAYSDLTTCASVAERAATSLESTLPDGAQVIWSCEPKAQMLAQLDRVNPGMTNE